MARNQFNVTHINSQDEKTLNKLASGKVVLSDRRKKIVETRPEQ